MKGNDGDFYSNNPSKNYVSRFTDGFRGWLDYDSVDHFFNARPDKANKNMKQKKSIYLDVYRQTPVGLSYSLIGMLVPDNISAEPYRKELIEKIFFHQIFSLIDSLSVSCNDLLGMVAAYFHINTGPVEKISRGSRSVYLSFFLPPFKSYRYYLF